MFRTRTRRTRTPLTAIATLALVAAVLAGCGGSGSPGGSAGPQLGPAAVRAALAAEVQRDIAAAWPKMTEVWTGSDHGRRVLILAGAPGEGAEVIDVAGVTRATAADLARARIEVPPSGYAKATWRGRAAVVMAGPDPVIAAEAMRVPGARAATSRLIATAATRESFRLYDQRPGTDRAWPALSDTAEEHLGHGAPLPPSAAPRLYRASLINALRLAWLEPERRPHHLAAAAYWQGRWADGSPEEYAAARHLDLLEGVGGYVQTASALLMPHSGNPRTYKKQLAYDAFAHRTGPADPDAESREIGGLACLIMAEQEGAGEEVEGWQEQLVESGTTPAELLLDEIEPAGQREDTELARRVAEETAAERTVLARTVDPMLKAYRDRTTTLLLVPSTALRGPFLAGGQHIGPEGSPRQIYGGVQAAYETSSGAVEFTGRPAFEDTVDSKRYLVVPIDPADPATRLTGRHLVLAAPRLAGSLDVTATTRNGRRLLIAR
ncbi:hypothetical protein [Streptomyces sp. NPDC006879]|uniref:hypothetical protein n=1 Tax=Streptomyces sp. NPDC006879 TaxID=3364767 RepID=UPI0036D0DABC